MPFSGDIGIDVGDEVAKILARQTIQAKLEEDKRQAAARQRQEQAEHLLRIRQHEALERERSENSAFRARAEDRAVAGELMEALSPGEITSEQANILKRSPGHGARVTSRKTIEARPIAGTAPLDVSGPSEFSVLEPTAAQAKAAGTEANLRKIISGLSPVAKRAYEMTEAGVPASIVAEQTRDPEKELEEELRKAEGLARIHARFRPGPVAEKQWVIGPDGKQYHRAPQPGDRKYEKDQGGASGSQTAYSDERARRTVESIDGLMGKVNRWTTGIGSVLGNVPESDARNFKAELDTLKANVAFNELAEMRAASKTGGALGNVSDRELTLLSSALGALDQGQSPENIKAQLQRIKESVTRWNEARGGRLPQTPPGADQMQTTHGGPADPLGIRRPK